MDNDGTLEPMRRAAILLIVTLTGPSIATAVCELSCLRGAHHETTSPASSTTECHDHGSSTPRQSLTAAGGPCHEAAGEVTAVIEAATQLGADPAVRERQVVEPGRSGAIVSALASQFRPPDILRITTQLRI